MSRRSVRSFLLPGGLNAERIVQQLGKTIVVTRTGSGGRHCPGCGERSHRVHSRYRRTISDLPAHGCAVSIEVTVRRFRCASTTCRRQTFVEPLGDEIARPFARRTSRLDGIVHCCGLALGGRPAARLVRRLMLPVSRDTLLRTIRRHAWRYDTPLRIVGIDDWAWKRGLRYGTLICDLERRRRLQYEGYRRRKDAGKIIKALAAEGMTVKEIVRRVDASRNHVRDVIRNGYRDVFRSRQTSLAPDLATLDTEWIGGCRRGAELWRRLQTLGFPGSLRIVSEWATRRKRSEKAGLMGLGRVPSARVIARLMTVMRDTLSKGDATMMAAVAADVPSLVSARNFLLQFQAMVRSRTICNLQAWIDEARKGLISSFAIGLKADYAAVASALTEPWSNGQTEGQITKLKLVKRQMYGRANLDLLRARLIG